MLTDIHIPAMEMKLQNVQVTREGDLYRVRQDDDLFYIPVSMAIVQTIGFFTRGDKGD